MAIEFLSEAVRDEVEDPDDLRDLVAEAYRVRGAARRRLGLPEAGESDLTAALDIADPESVEAMRVLIARGCLRYARGYDGAENDLTAAIEHPCSVETEIAHAYFHRGQVRWDGGRRDEAVDDFLAAINRPDSHARMALNTLADCFRSVGMRNDEMSLYRAVLRTGRLDLVSIALPRLGRRWRVVYMAHRARTRVRTLTG